MFESSDLAAQAAGPCHAPIRYARSHRAGQRHWLRLTGQRRWLRLTRTAAMLTLTAALAACGGGSSPSAAAGSTLLFADVAPFSGPDAALGPIYLVSCDGTTNAINKAGGILGHKVACTTADTRGEPADAVPAVGNLFATAKNLELVIGCTSDEAASVVPVINQHKTVMFCMTGQSEFDHVMYPYFYRLVPPDLAESYAMTVIAQRLGYHKIALAFGNDIGSQTFVQPAIAAIAKAGLTLVANETLDLNATTFRTEAAKIVAAHPDAIMTEALGSADPTLLAEIKQLNNNKMIPVIGTSAAISPVFYSACAKAVGAADFAANFHADNLVTATSGPAYDAFTGSLLAVKGKVSGAQTGDFTTYFTAPGAVHLYDGMNLAALAMVAAGSTDVAKWKPWIATIGNGVPGAVVVSSFAEGVAALKKGEKIRYIGPGGPTSFDAYHDSPGIFQIDTYSTAGAVVVAGNISAAELRAVSP
ncbi:MAG TPA: ABC transporter substrate-binding protein [Streptosporangiaceae bacterium]|nr:ABC transporter substrate-binding protein [Streptosporangiaceae bacterium]